MLERILTSTQIYIQDTFSAEELSKVITYSGGVNARACIIQDNRDFEYRDMLIEELQTFRDVTVLNEVYPNPKSADIMGMAEALQEKKPDVIIGIGGGSALDSAKAVAMILDNGGDLDEYLGPEASRTIGKSETKLILIPTTAGTGSEVTQFGVYTARSGRKYTLNHPLLQADMALMITQLTYTLPPKLTAATGFDALSHALETLWNRKATSISDVVAIDAAVYLLQWMEIAYRSSVTGDRDGRKEMLQGAAKAGIAFNLTGTAAVHALSFILSEEWHVPHGVACAFTLENVLELNARDLATRVKLAKVARRLFGDDSEEALINKLAERIVFLKKKMTLPVTFADLKVEVDPEKIPELFDRSFSDPKMGNNIVDAEEQRETIFSMLQDKTKKENA